MPIRIGTKTASPGDPSPAGGRTDAEADPPLDHAAWVRLAVSKYEKPLVRYASHMLGGDAERARDLAQDVFLKLCDQDRAKIGAHLAEWLYTVCRNLAIDVQRKERRMRLLSDAQAESYSDPEPEPADAAEADDSYAAVVRAMDELPFNQQEVIRLKFQHGLSYKQISDITSLTVTNVGFLIHTGLKTLRRQLADGVSHA